MQVTHRGAQVRVRARADTHTCGHTLTHAQLGAHARARVNRARTRDGVALTKILASSARLSDARVRVCQGPSGRTSRRRKGRSGRLCTQEAEVAGYVLRRQKWQAMYSGSMRGM
eukprot:5032742-Pleurochrysis_carterae.AAC.2